MPIDMTEIARAEQDRLRRLDAFINESEDGEQGVVGLSDPDMGVNGDEMQAVFEIETEEALQARLEQESREIELAEQIASLKNELAILQNLHGAACQGWSDWQQKAERYLADLRFIYGVTDGALHLGLEHVQLEGMLLLVKHSAGANLPEFDGIPY